jgi:hypothetical protein
MKKSEIVAEAKRLLLSQTPKMMKVDTKKLTPLFSFTEKEKQEFYKSLVAWGKIYKKTKIKPLSSKNFA